MVWFAIAELHIIECEIVTMIVCHRAFVSSHRFLLEQQGGLFLVVSHNLLHTAAGIMGETHLRERYPV